MKTITKETIEAILDELKEQAEFYRKLSGYKRKKRFEKRYKGIAYGFERARDCVEGMLTENEYSDYLGLPADERKE